MTKVTPPAFKGVWRTKTARTEATLSSISEAIEMMFYSVALEEQNMLLGKLTKIHEKMSSQE